MPELPEVETVRLGLEPVMLGNKIVRVNVRQPSLRQPVAKNFARSLAAKKIAHLIRRGKYILALGEDETGFGLHLGMSGRIKLRPPAADRGEEYASHDHVVFIMENGTEIIFNDPRRFGMVFPVGKNWSTQKPFAKMGAEPLEKEFTGKVLAAKLKNKNVPIKTALLDQNVVAGVGNIYACEALYHSGINPARKARTLTAPEVSKLTKAIKMVLNKAIKQGGSTLRDHRKTDGTMGYSSIIFPCMIEKEKPARPAPAIPPKPAELSA